MSARISLAAALAALATAPCGGAAHWCKNYDEAIKTVSLTGQPMVVAFGTADQTKTVRKWFEDSRFGGVQSVFVFAYVEVQIVNGSMSHALFSKYPPGEGQHTLPIIFFTTFNEKVLTKVEGQQTSQALALAFRVALQKHGPVANLKQVREAIATLKRADALFEKDQYGPAAKLYQGIIELNANIPPAAAAKEKLGKIEEYANKQLAEARNDVADKAFPEAAEKLVALARNYPSVKAGQEARDEIAKLREVPEAKDALAEAEKAKPEKPDESKPEPEAPAAKDQPEANDRFNVFTEEELDALDEMAEQGKPKTEARPAAGAGPECRRLLGLAQNWISNKQPEKARPLLRRIIEKYPDTIYADQAKAILATIE